MKEILESLRKGLTVDELAETFRKKTADIVPGDWKVVGVRFYLLEECQDVLATPGFYSKDFNKDAYDRGEDP